MLLRYDWCLTSLVHRLVYLLFSPVVFLLFLPFFPAETISPEPVAPILFLLMCDKELEGTLHAFIRGYVELHAFPMGVFAYSSHVKMDCGELALYVIQTLEFPAVGFTAALFLTCRHTGGVCEQCLKGPTIQMSARSHVP